jgi:hypothetical protein
MNEEELKDLVSSNLCLLNTAQKIRNKNNTYSSIFMKLDYICTKLNESYRISYQMLLDKHYNGKEEELRDFLDQGLKKQN